jgi:hypothetical protein
MPTRKLASIILAIFAGGAVGFVPRDIGLGRTLGLGVALWIVLSVACRRPRTPLVSVARADVGIPADASVRGEDILPAVEDEIDLFQVAADPTAGRTPSRQRRRRSAGALGNLALERTGRMTSLPLFAA